LTSTRRDLSGLDMTLSWNPDLIRSAQAHARDRGDETTQAERPATATRSGRTPDATRAGIRFLRFRT